MNADAVLRLLAETYPRARTALAHETPFQLLVATMLSAQSTDAGVNRVTAELFRRYPDARAFARLEPEELESHIRTLGLYRNKARHIIATARKLVEEYAGEVPRTREELERLPGVGPKTANVVLANAFGVPAIAVDTHVHRVANRLGLARASDPLRTEQQLMAVIPEALWAPAHHWLIWHGRQVCHARKPRCEGCPLEPHCRYARERASTREPMIGGS